MKDDSHELKVQVWTALLSKNIIDLRIAECITEKWLTDLIVNFGSSKNQYSKNKLRDIELKLSNTEDVGRILLALKDNFMVKTVKLETFKPIDQKTEQLAKEFRDKRIATEVSLNSRNRRFRIARRKCFEIFYPDSS